MDENNPVKQEETGQILRDNSGRFVEGHSGNPLGRPKRKTLTELIHAKLDELPDGWNSLVNILMEKVFKEKDKEIMKLIWEYTDGKPKQSVEVEDTRQSLDDINKLLNEREEKRKNEQK